MIRAARAHLVFHQEELKTLEGRIYRGRVKILEQALKMRKVSATGGFRLFVGVVVSNSIMAIGIVVNCQLAKMSVTEHLVKT